MTVTDEGINAMSSLLPSAHYELLFRQSPVALLVLRPNRDFTIVEANDARLSGTLSEQRNTIGRPLFEVFPDNPEDEAANGVRRLRESLERVLTTGKSDAMAIQKYDIPTPGGGAFEERSWNPVNAPVFDVGGKMIYIVHWVEDVTRYVFGKQGRDRLAALQLRNRQMEAELLQRNRELALANSDLRAANAALEHLCRRLREVSAGLHQSQELERRRIARDLHDEIGQNLTALRIRLATVAQEGMDAAELEESLEWLDAILAATRDMSLDLRPSVLDDLGLAPALRWYLKRTLGRAGLRCEIDLRVPERLPEMVEITCFRIFQEALTNVLRHSAAQRLWLSVRVEADALLMEIADDGVGFDVGAQWSAAIGGASFGLLSMQERAQLLGGDLTVYSGSGEPTRVIASLPLP